MSDVPKSADAQTVDTVETPEVRDDSFAELLEKTSTTTQRLRPGEKVTSRVITVTGDTVYIDLGGKREGIIDAAELKDETGTIKVSEGDEINAFFVSVQDGMKRFTTLVHGYPVFKLSTLRDAHAAGLPVTGEVKREVKGGFEISVGGVRCFCPLSQIDLKGGREGGVYLGQTFPFRVLKFEEDGRNVILSRRVVLDQERQAKIEALKASLEVGQELTVPVTSLLDFGAFVDLGGVEALIPASEISWSRVDKPSDVLSLGQLVKAKVIALDWERRRFTLSLKALEPDPWTNIAEKYPVDSMVLGTVVRLATFGAFVNLEPGIDGLVHISNLGAGRRVQHPQEIVTVGQQVEAYVLSADPANKKLSLSLRPRPKPKKLVLPAEAEVLEGVVEKVMPFGIFLKFSSGVTGLIPNSEMGTARGTDHAKMFPSGTTMKVVVVEVDAEQGKVSLSRKGVVEREEQDEFNRFRESVKRDDSLKLGSLGEKLKAKLEEKRIRLDN